MSKDLFIYGAGGAGKELAFSLSIDENPDTSWRVKGFIDDDKDLWQKEVNDIKVLGGSEWLKTQTGAVAVCTVANPATKRRIIQKIKDIKTINFPLIIAPKSYISPFVEWGEGCIVAHPFCYITVDIKIGDFVFINCATRIGHDVTIGDYTIIYSDVDISGNAQLGSDCIIGSAVTINPGVKVGNGSIIGAGSVVVKDVPEYVVAAGVPAKIIKEVKES